MDLESGELVTPAPRVCPRNKGSTSGMATTIKIMPTTTTLILMARPNQDSQGFWISIVMIASAAYATLRYNICNGVPWADWPTWTLNKAFGVASLALLLVAAIRRTSDSEASCSKVFSFSVGLAAVHVVLSLVLMSPVYYPKFFVDEKLTLAAGGSMILGCVAAVIMARRSSSGVLKSMGEASRGVWMVVLVALLVALHALLQGFSGWFNLEKWAGGLPPITLISFILGVSTLVVVVWGARSHSSSS